MCFYLLWEKEGKPYLFRSLFYNCSFNVITCPGGTDSFLEEVIIYQKFNLSHVTVSNCMFLIISHHYQHHHFQRPELSDLNNKLGHFLCYWHLMNKQYSISLFKLLWFSFWIHYALYRIPVPVPLLFGGSYSLERMAFIGTFHTIKTGSHKN